MSMIEYLDELDAKATDYAIRVQIACAQAIVEAIREQTVVVEMLSTSLTLPKEKREAQERARVAVTVSRWDDDTETMSFDGTTFTTVRPCRDCGVLICGGPTRCLYCAGKLSGPAPDPRRLSRESFLRHLHRLADSTPSTESISDDEVALSAHDQASRMGTDGR